MPKRYPPLTPTEVIAILLARGFDLDRTRGSHSYYAGRIRGRLRHVTVDTHYAEFSMERIQDMIAQSGLTRDEFYGSTRDTARKINLRAEESPIPLD